MGFAGFARPMVGRERLSERVFAVEGELHGCLHCERKSGQHLPQEEQSRHAAGVG